MKLNFIRSITNFFSPKEVPPITPISETAVQPPPPTEEPVAPLKMEEPAPPPSAPAVPKEKRTYRKRITAYSADEVRPEIRRRLAAAFALTKGQSCTPNFGKTKLRTLKDILQVDGHSHLVVYVKGHQRLKIWRKGATVPKKWLSRIEKDGGYVAPVGTQDWTEPLNQLREYLPKRLEEAMAKTPAKTLPVKEQLQRTFQFSAQVSDAALNRLSLTLEKSCDAALRALAKNADELMDFATFIQGGRLDVMAMKTVDVEEAYDLWMDVRRKEGRDRQTPTLATCSQVLRESYGLDRVLSTVVED